MEAKAKFKVIFSEETIAFLETLPDKVGQKIMMNVMKSKYNLDPKLFKKLQNTNLWEFRTLANGIQYRLLAFWDHDEETFVITTHAFIKKSQKTPLKEIAKAEDMRKDYFKSKNEKR